MIRKKVIIIYIIVVLAIISVVWFIFFIQWKQINDSKDPANQFSGNIIADIHSGIQLTWQNLSTGNVINATDLEIFQNYLKLGKYRTYSPAVQPCGSQYNNMSYQTRSRELNKYLAKNTMHFSIASSVKKWYLYIELKEPTSNQTFIYSYGSNMWEGKSASGRLVKNKSLIRNGKDYLYKLDDISIIPYWESSKIASYNRIKDTLSDPSKIQFIGGYVIWFDCNYINEIIVARE